MLITPKKALGIILENARPLEAVSKSLRDAMGYCLAGDVRADRDSPPTDRSAMDGYAVRARDLRHRPRRLKLVGEVAAGSLNRPKVQRGTCVQILTGASIPPGADAVVKLEETEQDGDDMIFLKATTPGANIRKRAEEVRRGQVVLGEGTVLGAVQIGLCASVGEAAVRVYRRPKLTILCTGRELRHAGAKVGPHQLRDSNGPALRAALKIAGYGEVPHRIAPDDPSVLAAKLKSATARHDVVIITGGVSVGKYDFVPEALERICATIRFHGVAMKPGKPQLYATLDGHRHIFGLPGNPLSVLTGFHELVLPAIRRMSGFPTKSCKPSLRLELTRAIRAKAGRVEFVLARLIWGKDDLRVCPIKSAGSADLVAGAKADGAIVVPRNVRQILVGQLVEFRPWRPIP